MVKSEQELMLEAHMRALFASFGIKKETAEAAIKMRRDKLRQSQNLDSPKQQRAQRTSKGDDK
jgi:hypothetical protein